MTVWNYRVEKINVFEKDKKKKTPVKCFKDIHTLFIENNFFFDLFFLNSAAYSQIRWFFL